MASTGIGANNGGDAVVFPQDTGTGTPAPNDSNADLDAAGYFGLIARNTGESYKLGATISNIDTTNNTIDIGSGVVFVRESGNTVTSGSGSTYDTTLPIDMVYAVALPTSLTVDLDSSTSASLRLVVNPSAQDTVTVEHNTSPTNPSVIIGDADTSAGTFANRNVGHRVRPEYASIRDSDGYWNARYEQKLNGGSIEDAINRLITDALDATENRVAHIKVPYPRAYDNFAGANGWIAGNGPRITIPYFQNNKTRVSIEGPSKGPMATRIRPNYSGSIFIQKESAGTNVGGTSHDEGDAIIGLDILDISNSLDKYIEINEESKWEIKGCRFNTTSSTTLNTHIDVNATNTNFAGFGLIENTEFSNSQGTGLTAISLGSTAADDSSANATVLRDVVYNGTSQGTLLDTVNASDVVIDGGDAEIGDPAIYAQSNGLYLDGMRFEGDYGTTDNVTTPVEIASGVEGYYLNPTTGNFEQQRSWIKQSIIRGFGDVDLNIIKEFAPFYSAVHDIPAEHQTLTTGGSIGVTGKDINFNTDASTGATVGIIPHDLAGDKNLWRIDASVQPGQTSGHLILFGWKGAGSPNHYYLAADPNENLSAHGVTSNWVAHTDIGGSVTASNTGVTVDSSPIILTVIIEDADSTTTPDSSVRYLIDGNEVAYHSGPFSGLGGGGPRLTVESRDGNSNTMLVWALNPRILGRYNDRFP